MEGVENMAPLSDLIIVPQIRDDFAWPLEVKIEPEEITTNDGEVDCFEEEDIAASLQHICSLCCFAGCSLADLKRHIKHEHQQKQYKHQAYQFKPRKDSEMEGDSEKPLLQCNDCEYSTRWKSRLSEHVLVHSSSKPYTCDYCPYKSANIIHLRQHVERHMGIRPYACGSCGYSAQSLSDLKKHTRVHEGIRPFVCEICKYATTTNNYLKMHMMSKHTGERPFKCEHCDYRTARRGDLSSHMLSHAKDKPYMCPCGFKTARPAHLKRHMGTHSTNRKFECTKCRKRYYRMEDLKRHSKTHSTEKKHVCPFCEYRALAWCTIKRHISRRHSQESISITNNKPENPPSNDETKGDFVLDLSMNNDNSSIKKPADAPGENSPESEKNTEFVCLQCDYLAKHFQDLQEHISSLHSKSKDKPG